MKSTNHMTIHIGCDLLFI